MKNVQRLGTAFTLCLILTLPAYAGEISTTAVPQPTPPAITADGEISTGITGQTETPSVGGDISTTVPASDSVIDIALSLVRGVLSLF